MQKLSVTIITLNEAHALGACLASVAFADEIVVVDSGSTDDTVRIAQAHGARVVQQTWLGFGPQKQFAVGAASNDWILALDADERVSPELATAIQTALAQAHPPHVLYHMARANRFMGRVLRHGEGYPDWCVRLFDRRAANWDDAPVHEAVRATDKHSVIATLKGDLQHESAESLADYVAKQNRYSSIAAERALQAGERSSGLKMVASPLLRFVKFYVLRGGFLDGKAGFAHCAIGAFASFLKHVKMQ